MKKLLAIILCLAQPSWGAYTFISSTVKGQAASPNTTSAIDTTGADLIVIVEEHFDVGGTLSDSQSNTWTALTTNNFAGRLGTIYYCSNPSTNASHTFTMTGATVARLAVYAFSGSASPPIDTDVHTAQNSDVTTQQPGSITPAGSGELFVVGSYEESVSGTSSSIDSSFTGVLQANDGTWGIVAGYKISTGSGAENPTITFSSSNHVANSCMAAFKAAAGGGATTPVCPSPFCGIIQ